MMILVKPNWFGDIYSNNFYIFWVCENDNIIKLQILLSKHDFKHSKIEMQCVLVGCFSATYENEPSQNASFMENEDSQK